jgi:5-formyltetrahydrofolate cyclo-ligase
MADAPELDLPARKTALRAELRRRRLALSPRYRRQAALALARYCRRWLRREHTLAAYLSHGSEIDTRPLLSGVSGNIFRVFSKFRRQSARSHPFHVHRVTLSNSPR